MSESLDMIAQKDALRRGDAAAAERAVGGRSTIAFREIRHRVSQLEIWRGWLSGFFFSRRSQGEPEIASLAQMQRQTQNWSRPFH